MDPYYRHRRTQLYTKAQGSRQIVGFQKFQWAKQEMCPTADLAAEMEAQLDEDAMYEFELAKNPILRCIQDHCSYPSIHQSGKHPLE
jgi:hypothetical protein